MEECSSGVIGDATKEDAGCDAGKQRHREMTGQRMVLEASELSATQMYLVKELQSLTKPVLVVTKKKNRYQTFKNSIYTYMASQDIILSSTSTKKE